MIIIKIGGGKNILWDKVAEDIASLKQQVIIVHGANGWMGSIAAKLGVEEKMITSPSGFTSRYTSQEVMDILTMVYSGFVNKKIVGFLQKYGVNAVGLSGVDGKLWVGKRKEVVLSHENGKVKAIRDSLTGNVISVNTKLITLLLQNGYTPVITIPAIAENGEFINVDNDRAVAIMAKELGVKEIVMLFEAPGLLADVTDSSSTIVTIKKKDVEAYIKQTEGRMRKKLLGVKEAFDHGVTKIYFGDGRIEKPVSNALAGKGTTIH